MSTGGWKPCAAFSSGELGYRKTRLRALGVQPPTYRFQRGPVTFATSIYGAEELVFLIMDDPDLAVRFRDTIRRAMLGLAEIFDAEAGQSPRGFQFNDDNCCLLTAAMYELFAYPILQTMFDRYAPAPGNRRYQHSDSAMGHLLPVLARLNFTGVNFGPTLPVTLIRQHLPATVIEGQLAPFTFEPERGGKYRVRISAGFRTGARPARSGVRHSRFDQQRFAPDRDAPADGGDQKFGRYA